MLRHAVLLLDPDGHEFDVTSRVDLSGLGQITSEVEDDLASLTHSDWTMHLLDDDGEVRRFLRFADVGQKWQVILDRETGERRPKWDRIFTGVLDLPWSLEYDGQTNEVTVQAFSPTKILENASAEPLQRSFSGMTGSVTSGSKIVTLTSTSGLQKSDKIQLEDATNTETQTVDTVDSSTQVTCLSTWGHTFASAAATLVTPYYRRKGPIELAQLLFTQAGIVDQDIQLNHDLATYPVATDLNANGLPTGDPQSLVEEKGKISFKKSTTPKVADSPRSGFVAGTGNNMQGDWRPYLLNEPATIMSRSGAFSDDGLQAWDHTGGHYFSFITTAVETPPASGNILFTLKLQKDGVDIVSAVDQYNDGGVGASGWQYNYVEFEGSTGLVWVSYKRDPVAPTPAEAIKTYSAAGALQATVSTSKSGALRALRADESMVLFSGTTLSFYNPATNGVFRTVTVPSGAKVWTLKRVDSFYALIYQTTNRTRLIVFDLDWDTVADYQIGTTIAGKVFLSTYFDSTLGHDVGIVFASGNYYVLSKDFAGVIPYADFSGQSCGGALKDLAIATCALLTMDEYSTGQLRGRDRIVSTVSVSDLPDLPLADRSRPLWEIYRTSTLVSGRDENGNQIELIVGETGASARRAELSSNLISTQSLLQVVGNLLLSFIAQKREQRDMSFAEEGRFAQPLERWGWQGADYLVLKARGDLSRRTQELQLAKVS